MTSNKKMSQFDATQTQKFEHDENLKAKRVISVSSVISTQWSRVTVDTDSDVREATFFFDQYNEHNRVTVNNTNLQSKYFLLDDALNAHNYYVWFNIDSGGTDPALVGRTGLEVPLTASYGVNTIAQAIQIVLNISAPNGFNVSVHDNVLEIINAEVGQSDGARDGNSGFEFVNAVEGVTTQVDTITLSPPTDYIYLYNEFEKEFILTQNVVDKIDTQFNPVIDTNNQTPSAGVVLPAYLGTPYEDSLVINSPLPVAPADMYLGDWTEVTKYAQISAEESATDVGTAFTFYSIDGGNTLYRYTSALVSDTKGFATFPKGATHYCIGYQNRSASTNTYTLHTVLSYVQQGDLKFPANTPIDDDFMVSLNKTISVGKDPNLVYKDSRQGGYVDAFTSFDILGSGEVFDSGTIDCSEYTQISTELRADQEGTLSGVWYQDEAGTIPLRSFSVPYTPVDDIEYFSSAVFSQYLKLTFTNGATPQGFFHLRSRLDTTAKHGQMLGLESFIPPNSLTNVNRAVIAGENERTGVYQNVQLGEFGDLNTNIRNIKSTSFDELKVASRFAQIELKSAISTVSNLRNQTFTSGSGSITVGSTGEYNISTTALAGDSARLESGARGRYIPGYEAETGVGIRLDNPTYTGTQYSEWGYFDELNGMGFGRDSTGTYIFLLRDGTKTKTYQSNWNQDPSDGTGLTQFNLDLTDGLIFQIEFTWYGYGAIKYFIHQKDPTHIDGIRPVLVHIELIEGTTSISQPNLPINVLIDNGDATTARTVYVGGRQFSIYGEPNEKFRINGQSRVNTTLPVGVWTPLITFRRKAGEGDNQSVLVSSASILADDNIFYTFVLGGTLTGASFGNLTNVNPNETVCETDISATAITGGDFFGGEYVGVGNNQSRNLTSIEDLDFDFVGTQEVTLVARPIGAQPVTATAASFNIKEQW